MSKKFYTADLHFGHERIIELAYRPFKTLDKMHEALINNWNNKVGKNDLVYIVGDFCFGNTASYKEFADQLNGQKHLILGNHDRPHPEGFESIKQYHTVKDGNYHLVLFHWAIECWQGRWAKDNPTKTVIHLHGHSHGLLLQNIVPNRYDVGVDVWNYEPVTLNEILIGNRFKYINPNCNLKSQLCWQYVSMVNGCEPDEEILKVCKKCKHYIEKSK